MTCNEKIQTKMSGIFHILVLSGHRFQSNKRDSDILRKKVNLFILCMQTKGTILAVDKYRLKGILYAHTTLQYHMFI